MSYDLMVFRAESAPKTRSEFMIWYDTQTKWTEKHSYDDPNITSEELHNWFMEMINTFPALSGPYANDESDSILITDYCIGKEVIYVSFAWSIAEHAYEVMKSTAEKHKVGFFDASATDGGILFPDGNGSNVPVDKSGNLSSIQQIKKTALPGQENKSVKEILYSHLSLDAIVNNPTSFKAKKWWRRLFGY